MGASNLKIVRYDQGFTTDITYSTVLAEHSYSGAEIQTTNNDFLYFEFDPITLTGGAKGMMYSFAFTNEAVTADLSAYLDTNNSHPGTIMGRNFYPVITTSGRDFHFATGNKLGGTPNEVLFQADFEGSTAISGSVTANADKSTLDAGTAVGSWTLPGVNPGAIIANSGATNKAFVFDRALSGNTVDNMASAVSSRSVDLAGGEAMTVEMDLYAVRQANGQRVEFSLDDAAGNSAYAFTFRMNNDKDFYTLNASGQFTNLSENGTGVNNGFRNPAVDAYQIWGATMVHARLDLSSQPTLAGSRGATLSLDWNGDGDYLDPGEQMAVAAGPRSSGVAEISALRLSNHSSFSGGAWVDNITVTAYPGMVFAHRNHVNLAKYQATNSDGAAGNTPKEFVNDGFVCQDSRWVSNSADPHWIEITLAAPMMIGSAHLYSGSWDGVAMADATLRYWDGGAWVAIPGTSVAGNTVPELNLQFDAPVTAQVFRLDTTDSVARVKELALYPATADGSLVPFGSDLDLSIAKMRQNAATSIAGTNYPKLAMDGYVDDASRWESNAVGLQDLEISWLQDEYVRGIHLYSGLGGQPGTQIQDFEVAYYDSGTTSWVNFGGGTVTGNTLLERAVRFDAPVQTTKIRLRSLDAAAARIREIVVLPENFGSGYPLGTDAREEPPPSESFTDYDDAFYTIQNRAAGLILAGSSTGPQITSGGSAWFQVLLNIGTDTYRLRSLGTGACLEVASASTAPDAAIVEGVYSSAPHQRWRLVDTGDGIHFQIVNAWSGLVLDTVGSGTATGTAVVQSVSSSSQTQHWAITFQDDAPKRGQASFFHFNFMYRSNWAYNWNFDAENEITHGQYMPMQWGNILSTTPAILRLQPILYARADYHAVMGFNEPDLSDQSNISEENAAAMWPRLERMRLPLVGPVPANRLGAWRTAYENLAAEQGLRSDYMAVHWYAGCNNGNPSNPSNPSNIINALEAVWTDYNKPIWLTEFSTRDFSGTQTSWSRNDNYNWLAEFMWRAEELTWLKKYSVFQWGLRDGSQDPATDDSNSDDPTINDSPRLALHGSNDKTNPGYEDLSECGRMYAGWDGDTTIRDDKSYLVHNKATCLRLRAEAGASLGLADILSNDGPMQWTFSAAPGGKKYLNAITDGRRLDYDGSGLSLGSAAATGSRVEWELEEHQYGWFYIVHASSGKRLRITSGGVLNMGTTTEANDNTRWRFIHIGGATKPTAPDSRIGQWSLNESSGQIARDTVAPEFDGETVNAPIWSLSAAGRHHLELDGADQYVRVSGLPDLTEGFTIGLWAKSNTPTWNANGMLVSRRPQFVLHPNGGGTALQFNVFEPGPVLKQAAFNLNTIDGFDLTEWHHYAGSYSAATGLISLYVDGKLRQVTPSAAVPLQSDDAGFMQVGRDDTLGRYFDGAIDEVVLYNHAVTDAQIAAMATGFDDDQDGMEDSFERRIIEASNTDAIQTLLHVQPQQDFDQDGSTNLLEWYLATDAIAFDSPIQNVASDGANFSMMYTRRVIPGVTTRAKWSSTLQSGSWDTFGLVESLMGTSGDVQTIKAEVPMGPGPVFLRVEVSP